MAHQRASAPLAERMLHTVDLTPSGRPVLFPGEVESLLIDDAGIEFEEVSSGTSAAHPAANSGAVLEAESLRDGVASLTTHRLIWIDERPATGGNRKRAFAVPLVAVANASTAGWRLTSVFASPRVRMYVLLDPQGRAFSTAMAGVGGILRREAEQKQATDRSLQEAFSDLNALMAKASEMVKLAERMRQKLQQQQGAASGEIAPSLSSSSSSSSSSAAAASEELQDLLLKMGIESPVTRETAGALYHRQLSRELADFIGPVLEKTGGTMLLVDVYCIFNRARGTELISPDDLLKACSLWSSFNS
ncbi:unnamed protein product [Closterium sp. Yama58-4]|nr:unnamed protein product [Closterium sp. Yama58-4]